jgi:hypothetical protein
MKGANESVVCELYNIVFVIEHVTHLTVVSIKETAEFTLMVQLLKEVCGLLTLIKLLAKEALDDSIKQFSYIYLPVFDP